MPPGHRGDFLQQLDCFLVAGGLVALQQFREQDGIVGDDDIGDQPGALVADRHIEVSPAGQLFPAADLGNCRPQLMIGLEPVLRAMDISLQLRVSEIVEGVDAAHQLIEFKDRLAGRVVLGQRTQLANQRALARFLESKGGDDPIDIGFLGANRLAVDLSRWLKQIGFLLGRVGPAIQMLDLRLQVGEARRHLQAEPVQDGKVRLVDAVHVPGDRGWYDVGGVVVADVKDVVAFMLVGADQFRLKRHVIGEQGVGDDAFASPEVFARVSGLDCRCG